jgi:AcrR family transcriptional regulator
MGAVRYRSYHGERTHQEILNEAAHLASIGGLEGLTIGGLAKELKMSKSGLFAHFGSKEELQLAVVEAAGAIFIDEVIRPALSIERGLVRLQSMLDNWVSYIERSVFKGGCFFAAASAEFDSRSGPVRERIVILLKSWMDTLEDEVRQAQSLSQLNLRLDPSQLVFEVHAFVQEANWAFQLFRDRRAFDRARQAIRWTIESAKIEIIKNR